MCDAMVRANTTWPRWYPCERKGKYEVEVTIDTWSKDDNKEVLTVFVCGQHKNKLGQGDSMSVRIKGRENDVYVRGIEDERGRLKNEAEEAQRLFSDIERKMRWSRETIGRSAINVYSDLLDILEDHDHEGSPLFGFVEALKDYQRLEEIRGERWQKEREAAVAYEEYKRK